MTKNNINIKKLEKLALEKDEKEAKRLIDYYYSLYNLRRNIIKENFYILMLNEIINKENKK